MQTFRRTLLASSIVALAPALATPLVEAASSAPGLEEVVVTGTRKEGQAPTETLAPIDVISSETLTRMASFNLTDGLTQIAPSLNTQRFPIADGTAFVRPVTLRNLSPDHTLVLVDGTRRHRSALVNLQLAPLGTVNQGSQGVDFSTFPSAAIKRVEVLRDGASAQYGSDAIAGVIRNWIPTPVSSIPATTSAITWSSTATAATTTTRSRGVSSTGTRCCPAT